MHRPSSRQPITLVNTVKDEISERELRLLRKAIARLPPMPKLIMQLHMKGHNLHDIARRLEMAYGTVSYHYHRRALPLLRSRVPELRKLLGDDD